MPNISEFRAPALRIQPSEIGVEATAAAGRRAGAFYNQAGEGIANMGARLGRAGAALGDAAVAYEDHREISAGSSALMGLVNQQTTAWNETAKNADPNDPSIKQKFIEENLNPALEQFKQGFTTQRSQDWAEARIEHFRNHMNEKTTADMSALAADAVHMNVNKSVNLAVSTVTQDPSSLQFSRDALKGSIGDIADSSPNLTPQNNAKIKNDLGFKAEQELVHAAISGTIAKGGDWEKIANDPKNAPFINRPELETFAKAAKAQAKSDLLTQKQLEQYQKQQNVDAAHTQSNKVFTDNVSYDATTGRIDIKPAYFKQAMDIARMPNAPEGLARTLINWGEAQQRAKKESIITDPATKKTLYDGLFSADNPTTEVALMKAQIDGKLSNQDFQQLHRLQQTLEEKPLKGPLYQGTMEAVKGMLGTSIMPDGHERYGNFVQSFIPAYLSLPEKDRGAALNLKDPNSLISKSMEGLKPTPAQLMMGHALRGTGLWPEAFQSLSMPGQPAPPRPTVMPPPEPGQQTPGRIRPATPAPLRGVAALDWSPSKQQFRDAMTGKIYDRSGNEVK